MKPVEYDAHRLDVGAFAVDGAQLEGAWPVSGMARLSEDSPPAADGVAPGEVSWRVEGEARPVKGGEPELWLHLEASATVSRECQRCLAPVAVPVSVDQWLRFVSDETQAAELDADSDDDVLALPRWLDLQELVEDELLLALPLVPSHDECPQPLPMSSAPLPDEGGAAAEQANPFAALAALKKAPGRE